MYTDSHDNLHANGQGEAKVACLNQCIIRCMKYYMTSKQQKSFIIMHTKHSNLPNECSKRIDRDV